MCRHNLPDLVPKTSGTCAQADTRMIEKEVEEGKEKEEGRRRQKEERYDEEEKKERR